MSKRRKRPDWKSVLGLREGPPSKAYAVLIFLLAFVVSGALALMRPDLPIVYVGLVVVAIILFALYTRNPVANKWARRFSSAVNSFLFFAIGFGLGRPDPNLDRLGDLFFMVVLWGAVTLRTTAVMDNNEQEERKQEEERAQQRHEDLLTSIKRAEQLAQK